MDEVRFQSLDDYVISGRFIRIGLGDDNLFYALHQTSPYFCLPADTWVEASNKAREAFLSYDAMFPLGEQEKRDG